MTSNIVTITVVIAPTIVMITFAMADIMALIPPPIAEKIEPMMSIINNQGFVNCNHELQCPRQVCH
jgi:hypothetical protein